MEQLSHLYDYTGNLIFIYQNALDNNNNPVKISEDQYMNAVQAILAPEMTIVLNNGRTHYYYRSICLDKTLLVGVIYTNGLWELQELIENPSSSLMLTLARKGLLEAYRLENETEGEDR